VTDEWSHGVSGTRKKKAVDAVGPSEREFGPKENRPTAGLPGHQAEISKVRVFPFYIFFYIFQSIFPIEF
jgi:hypothetical protein